MTRLAQAVTLLILVAIATQIGFCAFDDCGNGDQRGGISQSSYHCHNCICVGAASHNIPAVAPSFDTSFVAVRAEIILCEAPPKQLFLPPRA